MSDENRQTGGTPQEATPVPPSPPDATLDHRGDSTIVGDYELLDEVARGGMGVVYRARQRSLDRIVALKLILSGGDASEEELSRFRVEAQASARLDHPYIVPVYGFGRLDGHPFLAMGFVNGPSLAVRLARNGPLPAREAAELLCKVAEAIHFAHSQGIIHRDLKPGNVLIDQDGEPRVTDFGLAKRQDMEHGLTNTGQVLGTPAYMPPEQAAGDQVGPTGDIYSLGATLYAALCGQPPFEATSLPELLMKVAEEPPQPLEERDRRIPRAQCDLPTLSGETAGRTLSHAQDLVDDLQRFLSGSAVLGARSRRSIRWPLLVGGTLALVLLASGIGWAWFGRGQPVEETRVAPARPQRLRCRSILMPRRKPNGPCWPTWRRPSRCSHLRWRADPWELRLRRVGDGIPRGVRQVRTRPVDDLGGRLDGAAVETADRATRVDPQRLGALGVCGDGGQADGRPGAARHADGARRSRMAAQGPAVARRQQPGRFTRLSEGPRFGDTLRRAMRDASAVGLGFPARNSGRDRQAAGPTPREPAKCLLDQHGGRRVVNLSGQDSTGGRNQVRGGDGRPAACGTGRSAQVEPPREATGRRF
ncbi:MAG: serine/threonine-protein kinase [Pirellulales bacterium]